MATLVSITDFGAIGDGTTDNGAAIRAAIDHAKAIGGDVYVPEGTFLHKGLLTLDGLTLFGEGRGSVLKAIGGEGQPPEQAVILTGTGAAIRNVVLDASGNLKGTLDVSAKLLVRDATNFEISGISVLNSFSDGIRVVNSWGGVIQRNSLRFATVNSISVAGGSHDILIQNNRIDRSGEDGISVDGSAANPTHDIRIMANALFGNQTGRNIAVFAGEHIEIANNATIGNMLNQAGIYVGSEGTAVSGAITDVWVHDNRLTGTGGNATGEGSITLNNTSDHPLQNVRVTANWIEGAGVVTLGPASDAAIDANLVNSSEPAPAFPSIPPVAAPALNLTLTGSAQGDVVVAQQGNDYVRGLDGNDRVEGGDGNDDVNGNQGQDTVFGNQGVDLVRGGKGDDIVYGNDGDDIHVNGNIGNDRVYGGAGADLVFGGQDRDMLWGDDGNDTLSGDLGNDTLSGGFGADLFVLTETGGADLITDFSVADGDRIRLAAGTTYTVVASGNDARIELSGGANITLQNIAAASVQSDWILTT